MLDYTKEKQSKLLRLYLIIVLLANLIGVIIFVIKIYLKLKVPNFMTNSIFLLMLLIFVFSIYCLFQFKKQKLHKITFILPIINIILFPLLFLIGIVVGIIGLIFNSNPYVIINSNLVNILNLVNNLFEIIIASYLLTIFKK